MTLRFLIFACLTPVTAGCGDKTASPFNGITLDQSVQSYEDGKLSVYATPYSGGSVLVLNVGDAFVTNFPGSSDAPLVKDGSHYSTIVSPNASPPLDVSIDFLYANGRAHSIVTLPAPPRIASAPATVTEGEDLAIDLAAPPPSGARVRLRFLQADFGDFPPTCVDVPSTVEPTRVDGTRIVLSSATLFARDPKHSALPVKQCNVTVRVRFETDGARDPSLAGGSMSGLMERPAYPTGSLQVTRTAM